MAVERTADLYTEFTALRTRFVFIDPGPRHRDDVSADFPYGAVGRERRKA